jgi:hypothetical protein
MALIREAPAFPLVAAFAGVVWTVSAAEALGGCSARGTCSPRGKVPNFTVQLPVLLLLRHPLKNGCFRPNHSGHVSSNSVSPSVLIGSKFGDTAFSRPPRRSSYAFIWRRNNAIKSTARSPAFWFNAGRGRCAGVRCVGFEISLPVRTENEFGLAPCCVLVRQV